MARPDTLVPGNCYFSMGYYDNDLLLPTIDTLVYVGQGEDEDHERMWLFKEPDVPADSGEAGASPEPPPLVGFTDRQLHEIVDIEGLLQKLRAVACDHPLKPIAKTDAAPATDEELGSLPGEVERFLNDPECLGLTMTIRFTADWLSLSRREAGFDMCFSTHPRLDPDEDSKILSLFAGIGLHPVADYFYDRGRTRSLQFPLPQEPEAIAQICRRVLAEVYSVRRGDVIDYHRLRKSDA
jgi:hypothetical protein